MAEFVTACSSLHELPHSLHFLFSSSPHFPPPLPGSVLFDPDQLQHAYSSFYHLSSLKCWEGGGSVDQRHMGQGRGSKSYRGNSCMMWCQIIGICGGRIGDSGNSCSHKVPMHQSEAFKVTDRPLPKCPYGTRHSAFIGSLNHPALASVSVSSSAF